MAQSPFNVLFLCTGNSARSIMAEAILNAAGGATFRAYSAGSAPAGRVHPEAIDLLERHGLPTQGLHSKGWDAFAQPGAPRMDFVITVCDRARAETCPVWPGQPLSAHWGVEDPVAVQGEEARRKAFADAFLLLRRRIALFADLPIDKLHRLSLQAEMDRIGLTR